MTYKLKSVAIPKVADFTIINVSDRAINNTTGGIYIDAPARSSVDNMCALVKAVPTAPYKVSMNFKVLLTDTVQTSSVWKAYSRFGCVWRSSSDGYMTPIVVTCRGANAYDISANTIGVFKFRSTTDYYADYTSITQPWYIQWIQLCDDGVNRSVNLSRDGINWYLLHSMARTDFITPDQIGFCISPWSIETHIILNSFKVETTG